MIGLRQSVAVPRWLTPDARDREPKPGPNRQKVN